jgi:hypothetical protein
MRRHWFFLAVMSVLGVAFDQREAARDFAGDEANVILVVSDGLRWQEVFRGADSTILFGDSATAGATRAKYWRESADERRQALMPFVWSTLARSGQLLGNRDIESRIDVANAMRFSYPGYNEMLTGRPDPRIDSNEFGPNPNVTVFEWLNRRDGFQGRVGVFGTWDVFRDIFNVDRSKLDVHTNGAKPVDILVHRAVMRYLDERQPRALFVGFAETDDWGHEGRYDRYLEAAHAVDAYMAELWSWLQSHPRYRGRTTLIIAADHGRGRTNADWRHHGKDVPGAEETFLLRIGPEVDARGEVRRSSGSLGEVAAATASAVGFSWARSGCATRSSC